MVLTPELRLTPSYATVSLRELTPELRLTPSYATVYLRVLTPELRDKALCYVIALRWWSHKSFLCYCLFKVVDH
jgi:hypothetical protein